jgi:peptide/nickel transport system substrate-binding protein
MKLRYLRLIFGFIPGMLLLVCSCTQKRDLSQNTLIVHILAEPKGLHPTNDNNAYQRMIFQCTQRRLMTFDLERNTMVPELLADHPVLLADSMSYRCIMRDDIFWDDGSAVEVSDVIFTFKLIICPLIDNPDQKGYFENFQEVIPDPLNKRGFIIINRKRYFDNESMLAQIWLLQRKIWDPAGLFDQIKFRQLQQREFSTDASKEIRQFAESFNSPENGRNPSRLLGLGPYKVSNWHTGVSITLEKKNHWWGLHNKNPRNNAWPDKIIFTIIKDMEPLVLALKKQQIDVSMDLSTAGLTKLQKRAYFNRNYHSAFIGSFSYTYMGMNMRPEGSRMPFFTDQQVRKAMAHIVPVDEIIQITAKGIGKRIASFGLPGQADFNDSIALPEYSIEKARKMLDKSGWIDTDGDNIRDKIINGKKVQFSFSLSYMISPVTRELALLIRNSMYKAGIEARPDPMDFAVFYQHAANHEFDAMLGSWSSSAGPEDPRQIWHTSSWVNNGSNFTGFGNAQTDSLIERMNMEMNPVKRNQMMKIFQEIVAEAQPYVFIYNATRKIAIHKRFENATMYPERPNVLLNNLKLNSSAGTSPASF